MVELFTVCIQRRYRVPPTFPVGLLAEHYAQQLVPAGEMFHTPIAPVAKDDRIKHTTWKKICQLSEKRIIFGSCKPLFAVNLINFYSLRVEKQHNRQITNESNSTFEAFSRH